MDNTLRTPGATGRVTWNDIKSYFALIPAQRLLIPLPQYRVIYVKNPKAASSTLMVWLDRIHTGDPTSTPARMHRDHHLPTLRDVGRRRVMKMLSGQAYRFSFVRDPLRRLESVYWAKMFRDQRFRRANAPRLGLSPDPAVRISFEEFLTAIERQDPLREMDPHWRAQHLNLLFPIVEYDHIGKLETFEHDLRRVEEESGLPHVPLEPRNVAPQRPGRTSVYEGRPDLRRRVEELYAQDMELFGY
jgi:hypothetical protein